jgi:hypothetical protein
MALSATGKENMSMPPRLTKAEQAATEFRNKVLEIVEKLKNLGYDEPTLNRFASELLYPDSKI